MLEKVLESGLFEILDKKIGFEKINEIRLRSGMPIIVSSNGKQFFLTENGLSYNKDNAISISKEKLEDIVYRSSEFSIYSVNEELKQGYIVLDDGVRIGVSGTVILDEKGKIQTLTNFSSLNIRIPHKIKGVCLPIFDKLIKNENEIFNTLIISPPGQGKTTFLRDFAFQLSRKDYFFNLLILDERGEIAGKNACNMELGEFCDILSFCDKKTGFLLGIRSMNPNIILTDEIGNEEDFEALQFASNCGVKVVATIHAKNLEELKNKRYFEKIKAVFERFVLLKPFGQAGQIENVFDNNFNVV